MSNVLGTISEDYKGPFSVSDNYEKFLDIVKRVFPEKYEEKYAKLIDLIIDYSNISVNIERLTTKNEHNSVWAINDEVEMKELNNKLVSKEIEILNLEKIINEIPGDEPSYERLHYLQDLSILYKERINLQSELTSLSIKKHGKIEEMNDSNYSLSELQEKLQTTVEDIKYTMSEIRSLDINGEDRLSNIKVKSDHLAALESILDSYSLYRKLDPIKKEKISYTYKYFLLESIRIRKKMYELGEKVSEEIIEKHNNRELYNPDNRDVNLIKNAALTSGRWEIHSILTCSFPQYGAHWVMLDDNGYKRLNTVSECFSTISNIIDLHNEKTINIEDTTAAREKLWALSCDWKNDIDYNLRKHISSIGSIADDSGNMLSEYETNLKKESGMSF